MPELRKNESPWPYFAGGLAGVLMLSFFLWQIFQEPAAQRSAIDERIHTADAPRPRSPFTPAAPPPSSLAFTGSTDDLPLAGPPGPPAHADAAPRPEEKFREAVAASEARARALAIAYTKRHPSIASYGRDWMSYPDLKKLNDDYMRERDPIKFMRGLARSENFPVLVKKYAADPAVHSFVIDAVKQAPAGLASAAAGYLPEDGSVKGLVGTVADALGLPKAVTAGILGGSVDPKELGQKQVLDEVLRSNPGVGKDAAPPAKRP